MAIQPELQEHLRSGSTTLCRAWAVIRKDGKTFGFTDHDLDLNFDDITFRADTGMAAQAIQQATGLAVDNTEAIGALSDVSLTDEDINAGRFDGADVRAWLVNWRDVTQRHLLFRGSLGEITRGNGAFTAELRGLTEALNAPQGRVYQAPCSAVLGDKACKFNTWLPGYSYEGYLEEVEDRKIFRFSNLGSFDERWFEGGKLVVMTGSAKGLVGVIKNDRLSGGKRAIEMWEAFPTDIETGDRVRFEAGCDKRAETCRLKFNNLVNFQGFPHIPGDDWLMTYPSERQPLDGGSLFR